MATLLSIGSWMRRYNAEYIKMRKHDEKKRELSSSRLRLYYEDTVLNHIKANVNSSGVLTGSATSIAPHLGMSAAVCSATLARLVTKNIITRERLPR